MGVTEMDRLRDGAVPVVGIAAGMSALVGVITDVVGLLVVLGSLVLVVMQIVIAKRKLIVRRACDDCPIKEDEE